MGIFNEQTYNHPFARGIQGAPGVGFNLTSSGDYDMIGQKLTNVGDGTDPSDAVTRKQLDNAGVGNITADIPNTMSAAAMIHATKAELTDYLKKDETTPMTGNLNMNGKQIFNLPFPTGGKQSASLEFTDLKYLARNGTTPMLNNLNMDNKSKIHLRPPTNPTDAATKKYVDDNRSTAPYFSPYLEKDGSVPMTGDLNVSGHKITNLRTPSSNDEAATKYYEDSQLHESQVQPSHYKDQFSHLVSSSNQWTDEIDGGNSFNIRKIDNLPPNKGNFHDYNHKVLYMTINKNSQVGYKYKMGINFYRLTRNTDYTLCLEILNTDCQLWHKSQISVDKGTSQGLTIGNVGVRRYSHRYLDPKISHSLCIITE